MKSLRVGLLGLSGEGEAYLKALRANANVELVCAADADARRIADLAEGRAIRTYEDCRSLIVGATREPLDALFVALEPFQSVDLLPLAAERGMPVFHKPPFARSVDEGRCIARRFADVSAALVVARAWRFAPQSALSPAAAPSSDALRAASVVVQTPDSAEGWRGHSARSGGGVLLNGAYEAVDELLCAFGVPESVYAECTMLARPGAVRKYDTEDIAAVTLRFAHERFAALFAVRGRSRESSGAARVSTLPVAAGSDPAAAVCAAGATDATLRELRSDAVAAAVAAFVDSLTGDAESLASTMLEHLRVLAVIEAAYLSAKTGAPESPRPFAD